jgi:hypothetical protein
MCKKPAEFRLKLGESATGEVTSTKSKNTLTDVKKQWMSTV